MAVCIPSYVHVKSKNSEKSLFSTLQFVGSANSVSGLILLTFCVKPAHHPKARQSSDSSSKHLSKIFYIFLWIFQVSEHFIRVYLLFLFCLRFDASAEKSSEPEETLAADAGWQMCAGSHFVVMYLQQNIQAAIFKYSFGVGACLGRILFLNSAP